jgi:hypothetical protein
MARACLLAAALAGLLLASPTHGEGTDSFRTIVVFGDTQDLMDSRLSDAERGGFRAMVDWVLEHREDQRIDFVLHVGDAISRGGVLPLGPECLDGAGRCDSKRVFQRPKQSFACRCDLLGAVDEEWARFNAEWRRFDGVVPYAIAQGNHDNLGVSDADGQVDRPGFAAFYGARHFEAVPGSGLVASHADDQGISHAWKLHLGERPVLVIGAAHRFSTKAVRWAEGVLDAHPGVPAIALAHQHFWGVPPREDQPRTMWQRLVVPHADRFPLAVCGHVSPGEVRFVDLGGSRLLRIRSDWQGGRALSTYLNLVRFYEGPGLRPEVEVLAFDPVRGRTAFERGLERSAGTRGRVWLPRQPFSFDAEQRPR